mgnify:CR=1 FL=1
MQKRVAIIVRNYFHLNNVTRIHFAYKWVEITPAHFSHDGEQHLFTSLTTTQLAPHRTHIRRVKEKILMQKKSGYNRAKLLPLKQCHSHTIRIQAGGNNSSAI